MVKTHDAEPERALALTEPALEVYKSEEANALNIGYHRLVRGRAESLEALDENEKAKAELATLHDDLRARGVNETVLAEIKAHEENL